jgi:hypothetical protein
MALEVIDAIVSHRRPVFIDHNMDIGASAKHGSNA